MHVMYTEIIRDVPRQTAMGRVGQWLGCAAPAPDLSLLLATPAWPPTYHFYRQGSGTLGPHPLTSIGHLLTFLNPLSNGLGPAQTPPPQCTFINRPWVSSPPQHLTFTIGQNPSLLSAKPLTSIGENPYLCGRFLESKGILAVTWASSALGQVRGPMIFLCAEVGVSYVPQCAPTTGRIAMTGDV